MQTAPNKKYNLLFNHHHPCYKNYVQYVYSVIYKKTTQWCSDFRCHHCDRVFENSDGLVYHHSTTKYLNVSSSFGTHSNTLQIGAYTLLGSFCLETDINNKKFTCHICGGNIETENMQLHYSTHEQPTKTAQGSAVRISWSRADL